MKNPYTRRGGVYSRVNSSAALPPLLDTLLTSVVLELDATNATSADGGQLWRNLTATPADGATQTAYDFTRGSTSSPSTDDPTGARLGTSAG